LRLDLLHQPFQRGQETPKKGLLWCFWFDEFFCRGCFGGEASPFTSSYAVIIVMANWRVFSGAAVKQISAKF